MGTVLGLGLAAALYPQLLAVVVVILTRPSPRLLLWACYLGALSVSVGCGTAVLLAFRERETVLESSSHRLGAETYLVLGAIVLVIAGVGMTRRGRELLGRDRVRRGSGGRKATGPVGRAKDRAGRALERGSVPVAAGVGGLLGLPGPFDLLAIGHIARGRYSTIAVVGLIAVFSIAKFLLIELPIVSYQLDPDRTAARVDRFSAWMRAHKLALIWAVVAIFGLVLVGRGIARLG